MVITLWFTDLQLLDTDMPMIGNHKYKATLWRVLKVDEAGAGQRAWQGGAELGRGAERRNWTQLDWL